MTNIVLVIILLVLILMFVFYMFSVDDKEDEENFLNEAEQSEMPPDSAAKENCSQGQALNNSPQSQSNSAPAKSMAEVSRLLNDEPPETQSTGAVVEMRPAKAAKAAENQTALPEVGGEDDLKLRVNLNRCLSEPKTAEAKQAVVACVQLRIPPKAIETNDIISLIKRSETVFEKPLSFDYTCYAGSQLDKLLFFGFDEERSDTLLEALIVAFELIARYKKLLKADAVLRENKVKIAVGISMGNMIKISRGMASEPAWLGRPSYVAESLAEAGGDLTIYTDEEIYSSVMPLFRFREWKPMKLRTPLAQLKLYELVGFNDPPEIASYAASKNAAVRKAVAAAYRYIELGDNIKPLTELISDSDEEVAKEALITLAEIGDDRLLCFLKKIFLETQNPIFRSLMIDAFASMGSKELTPLIAGSAKESSWRVRLSAVNALYKLVGSDAVKHLESQLHDSDGAVKAAANAVFFKATGKMAYFNELASYAYDLSKRTRKAAVDGLIDIASDDAMKIIVDSFAEQELELRKYILKRLEGSKSKILYQCLLMLFKKSDEITKAYIVEAVQRARLVS